MLKDLLNCFLGRWLGPVGLLICPVRGEAALREIQLVFGNAVLGLGGPIDDSWGENIAC